MTDEARTGDQGELQPIPSWLRISREKTGDGTWRIRLSYLWRRSMYLHTFFFLSYLVVMGFWRIHRGETLLWLVVPLAVPLLLYQLVLLVNRTTITVDPEKLELRYGPLPWLGGRTVDARRVSGAYSDGNKLYLILDGEILSRLLSMSGERKRLFALGRAIELALGIEEHTPQSDEKPISGDFRDLASWITPPVAAPRTPASPDPEHAAGPAAVRVSREGDRTLLSLPFPVQRPWVLVGAVPGLIWLLSYLKPETAPWYTPWSFKLPWILVDAAALVFAVIGLYLVAAALLNRTRIELTPERLAVRHGPLPWPAPGTLEADEVQQLYLERQGNRCILRLLRRDRVSLTLARGDPAPLEWARDTVQAALGLPPRKVSDELR